MDRFYYTKSLQILWVVINIYLEISQLKKRLSIVDYIGEWELQKPAGSSYIQCIFKKKHNNKISDGSARAIGGNIGVNM